MKLVTALRRGNAVKRYHTEQILVGETVGHHCANVAAILFELYSPILPSVTLLAHCLSHDVAEQYTGDLPAPVKKDNEGLRNEMTHAEGQWEMENFPMTIQLGNGEFIIFAFADIMDVVYKARDEILMGNTLALPMYIRAETYAVERLAQLPDGFHAKAQDMLAEAQGQVLECISFKPRGVL